MTPLDALTVVREMGSDRAERRGHVRVGAITGVELTAGADGAIRVPAEVMARASEIARDASPEHPRVVGTVARLATGFYELRVVGDARAPDGASAQLAEVVGPRTFDDQRRDRLARPGLFVGRTAQLAELYVTGRRRCRWLHND